MLKGDSIHTSLIQTVALNKRHLSELKGVLSAAWAPEAKDQDKQQVLNGVVTREMVSLERRCHRLREPNPSSSRASSNNTVVNHWAAWAVSFSPNIKMALLLKHPPNNSLVLGGLPGTLSNLPAPQLRVSSHPLVTAAMSGKARPRFMEPDCCQGQPPSGKRRWCGKTFRIGADRRIHLSFSFFLDDVFPLRASRSIF